MAEAEENRLAGEIGRILEECRLSHAVHTRKLRELAALRRSNSSSNLFFQSFTKALAPLFEFPRRTASAERAARFAAAFTSANCNGKDESEADVDSFLEEFVRFLLAIARAAIRPARFRACQIISEIIMCLPDDAEVSDDVWDDVIEVMKVRVGDKIPAIRAFAVRALSRFADDEDDSGIVDLFLETLSQEQNPEVRKTIILSLPPSIDTLEAIIDATRDANESVRKSAYCVISNKFPLQSLSIKHRKTLLQRGLKDRSPSVAKECIKMLKEEWLSKSCGGDPIALLRFLDVETYESVGEAAMECLVKDGLVKVQQGQSIRQYIPPQNETEGECVSNIKLMDAEVALYWKVMCKHLQAEAQAKGSNAASTTGTEAAVYASEASDSNDLLEGVLPGSISDYVALVKAHLSAGPNYRFVSLQLLLLGTMLDFSDSTNRKTASTFLHELLLRPLEYELDEAGNKIAIGDGLSLGGDHEWARAVSKLARKVHASLGEFETVIASVIEELARPCRERTADFSEWMHCLSVTGLLLEDMKSLSILRGRAIEPSELLHSLLLPAAKQTHIDVQRAAMRHLGLFGNLENRPSTELVKQLCQSFINGPVPVSSMACKALLDLVLWHGPVEINRAIGLESEQSNPGGTKTSFASLDFSDLSEDAGSEVLDLLYSGFDVEDWGLEFKGEDSDADCSVHTILGEGFTKILLLSENYPSISPELHPVILSRLIRLYFCEEAEELQRLKQCLSVFFEHYPALSPNHKRCISRAFIPLIRCMWPGIYGNSGGNSAVVSKMRKRAVQASRFMLQMIQTPLFSKDKDGESLADGIDSGEEGLAICIAFEVVSCPEKNTRAGKTYILALCRIAVLLRFRPSEQDAIKCMRGLLNTMIASVSSEKDLVRELIQMGSRLKSLDEHPDEELPQDQVYAVFEKLGLEAGFKLEAMTLPPRTPAPPQPARTAPSRRKTRRERSPVSDSDDEDGDGDGDGDYVVPASSVCKAQQLMTPGVTVTRSQRASKTAALTKIAAKTAVADSEEDSEDGQSDLTAEQESSNESGGDDDFDG